MAAFEFEFVLLIIIMVFIFGCILWVIVITFESTVRFKARAKTLTKRSSRLALYVINILITNLIPLCLLPLAFFIGVPPDMLIVIFTVWLVTGIGFGIALTQYVISRATSWDAQIEIPVYIIRIACRKSTTPKEEMVACIRSFVADGELSQNGAKRVLEAIAAKNEPLSDIARELLDGFESVFE